MTLRDYLLKHYTEKHIKGYENLIKRYCMTLGEKAQRATYADVLDYIGLLREARLHPKTLRCHLYAIKVYYRYLVAIGHRNDHPCQYLHLKDQINRQIQLENLYSKEMLKELYENWKSKNHHNHNRDKIIVSLLVYQALTCLEITELRKEDIDLEKATVYVRSNVRNKERILSLKSNQILVFHRYLTEDYKRFKDIQEKEKQHDYLLMYGKGVQLYTTYINRLINENRTKKLLPLKIRQSVIYHLLKSEHDLRIVQVFCGHRSTASTEAYRQTGLEELKSAIERLHPLQ